MGFTEKYELWKKRVKDRKLFRELLAMSNEQINSAFYKDLEFGTAGIRAIMGAGTNRINVYTVRKISQGIALYMQGRRLTKVAISFDSRINSKLFAEEAASVFASAGVTALVTATLMPTPFLSYATRRLGADIGVMITASHNSSKYNGYKVYDHTGSQIRESVAQEISECISQVDAFRVMTHRFDYYLKRGSIMYIDEQLENDYLSDLDKAVKSEKLDLSVVYTPLNGTGYKLVPAVLNELGCVVSIVESQGMPDGKFTTCPLPNPEKKEALKQGVKVLLDKKADLLIATDPDADRIGVVYLDGEKPVILSGNEIGVLMSEYLLSTYTGKKTPLVVRTFVSTELVDKIAKRYNAEVIAVATGFKNIGNVINNLELAGDEDRFLLGFEESQGYLVGTHARDKDGIVAAKLIAIIASSLKKQGKTLGDKLNDIYSEYGFYLHRQLSYKFEGEEGENKVKTLLDALRKNPLTEIARKKVKIATDYLANSNNPLNMIGYEFDGGKVLIRPSGTEPLVKLYVTACLSSAENEKIQRQVKKQFNEIFL